MSDEYKFGLGCVLVLLIAGIVLAAQDADKYRACVNAAAPNVEKCK